MNPSHRDHGVPTGEDRVRRATAMDKSVPICDDESRPDFQESETMDRRDRPEESTDLAYSALDAPPGILRFIEKVRSHSPDCLSDLVAGSIGAAAAIDAEVDAPGFQDSHPSDTPSRDPPLSHFSLL